MTSLILLDIKNICNRKGFVTNILPTSKQKSTVCAMRLSKYLLPARCIFQASSLFPIKNSIVTKLAITILILCLGCAPKITGKPGVRTTIEEIPGAVTESSFDQHNTYQAILDVVKKIKNEIPDDGKTAIVPVVNNTKTDMIVDLICEAAQRENKDVIKASQDSLSSHKGLTNRVEVYTRGIGIGDSLIEIPKSQILVANLNGGCLLSPSGQIARLGVLFTLLFEGKELGKVSREAYVAVSVRLIKVSGNKLVWSKIFKAKKGRIIS